MNAVIFAALHAGAGEMTALEYLFRVALHFVAVGGLAAVALWGHDAIDAVRTAILERRSGGENDP